MQKEELLKYFPMETPRHFQLDVCKQIIDGFESGFNHILLEAPTASGKSPIAVTIARKLGSSYVLTSQKSLQDQYMDDFEIHGLKTIKGRSNYDCWKNPQLTCDYGVCKQYSADGGKRKCSGCPYEKAKGEAYGAEHSIINYAYFISLGKLDETPQTKRELIVFDECHNIENELINFLTVDIDRAELKELGISGFPIFPKMSDDEQIKYDWLMGIVMDFVMSRLSDIQSSIEESSKDGGRIPAAMIKQLNWFTNIDRKLQELEKTPDDKMEIVIIHKSDFMITFKPLKGDSMMEDCFWKFGNKFLYMSATTNMKQICSDTGLTEDKILHIQCPATIPAINRPIYNMNIASLSYINKKESLPYIAKCVQTILDNHKGERGIIHTVSYDIAEYLSETINSPRFIMPRGRERDKILNMFFESSKNDLVLLSPSLMEGISLDDDMARFAIIVKLPYKNLGDPWILKRKEMDEEWYTNQTALALLQMSGRTVRSSTDFSKTYVLDNSFIWFVENNRKLFPDWWYESIKSRIHSKISLK